MRTTALILAIVISNTLSAMQKEIQLTPYYLMEDSPDNAIEVDVKERAALNHCIATSLTDLKQRIAGGDLASIQVSPKVFIEHLQEDMNLQEANKYLTIIEAIKNNDSDFYTTLSTNLKVLYSLKEELIEEEAEELESGEKLTKESHDTLQRKLENKLLIQIVQDQDEVIQDQATTIGRYKWHAKGCKMIGLAIFFTLGIHWVLVG